MGDALDRFFKVTLSTLRQLKKVPNEPGLSPNNSLEEVFKSVCDVRHSHVDTLLQFNAGKKSQLTRLAV